MNKQITLQNTTVPYTLRPSQRARALRVAIYPNAAMVVSAPYFLSQNYIDNFLRQKGEWIIAKIKQFKKIGHALALPRGKKVFAAHQEHARSLVKAKILALNQPYQFAYNKISIKNSRSRWGSCSKKGNLNFSYRLLFLPESLVNYIVVHELCHLREFNHSPRFWALVARAVPDYKKRVAELKKLH